MHVPFIAERKFRERERGREQKSEKWKQRGKTKMPVLVRIVVYNLSV